MGRGNVTTSQTHSSYSGNSPRPSYAQSSQGIGYGTARPRGNISPGFRDRGGPANFAFGRGGRGAVHHGGFDNGRGRGGRGMGRGAPSPAWMGRGAGPVTLGMRTGTASAPASVSGWRAPSTAASTAPSAPPSRPATAAPEPPQSYNDPASSAPNSPPPSKPQTPPPTTPTAWADWTDSRDPSRASSPPPAAQTGSAPLAPGTVLFSTQTSRGISSGAKTSRGYSAAASANLGAPQPSASWTQGIPRVSHSGPIPFRGAPRGRGEVPGRGRGGRFNHPPVHHQPSYNSRINSSNKFNYYTNQNNFRGRGRGRGFGRLWANRDALTSEALGSLQDDSYAATGALSSWASQTRPLSPPLEENASRPVTPLSLPPTPQGSPQSSCGGWGVAAQTEAMLDILAYPHIFDQIFALTPYEGLLVLRLVNRAVKDRVDAQLFKHVLVCTPERASGLILLSPRGDRLPLVPWDLDPAPAPDHRDYDDPIEEYFGPLQEEGNETAAMDAAYFSRMAQLRHVRTLDFYSAKSRIKPLALGLKGLQVVRSKPDWHWERHARKWRVQSPTFVSYLDLVQSWDELDDVGGWSLTFVDGRLSSPFSFLIPRTQHAVLHLHYTSERNMLPTRFRTLPDLESLTLVWHDAAGAQAEPNKLLHVVEGLPMLQLTLVGLEPKNILQAGDWMAPIYTRLDQLGTPNFRQVQIMTLGRWKAENEPLITQSGLTYKQPYIPINQDFGWDSDEEAFAKKYYCDEPEDGAIDGSSDVESDF